MKIVKGDLLDGTWDFACHVCNNHTTMGSGVAYFLRKKWPEVYEADLDEDKNYEQSDPTEKMGSFSVATLNDYRAVYNLYAMWGIGNDGHPLRRNCSYDSLFNAMFSMCQDILKKNPLWNKVNIGVPYLMGCARAGGSWTIVESIIETLEALFDEITFTVYQIEEFETFAQSTQPTIKTPV